MILLKRFRHGTRCVDEYGFQRDPFAMPTGSGGCASGGVCHVRMCSVTLLETIEDAFLSALEDGACPPAEFTVRLQPEAFRMLPVPTLLRTTGYTIHFQASAP